MELVNLVKKNQRNDQKNLAFNYRNEDAIVKVLGYVTCADESEACLYTGALGLPLGTPDDMAAVFLGIQRLYSKDSGRRVRHECLHLTPEEPIDTKGRNRAVEIFCRFALYYYYSGFQTVFSVHRTPDGYHAHYAVNTVSFCDGHKYPGSAALLNYQRQYASSLIGNITEKYAIPAPISWEEFEFSDSLYIPIGLFQTKP